MNSLIQAKINLLKDVPGTYLMKNIDGTIIYVGKAKSLIKRVKQYFYRPQVGKVFAMVREIYDFDTIETTSEKEALLLELNLIQKYYPKYNILLKDGKSYPYIALKIKDDPKLKIAYRNNDKNYKYFGPYPNSKSCYQTIDLLQKIFSLRKCKTLPKTPCIYLHMDQCLGPCINKISQDTYKKYVNDITRILKGDVSKILSEMKAKMKDTSENLEFEKAKEYKDIIDSLSYISEKQSIMLGDKKSRDVIAISRRDFYFSLTILTYRNGNLLGKNNFVIESEEDILEQVLSLLYQYYVNRDLPKEIIIADIDIKNRLENIIDTNIIVPTRGFKKDLLLIALENAKAAIDEHFMTARLEDDMLSVLEELSTLLKIKTPLRIELFDNSHLQGEEPIGAMVCFVNGVKTPSLYRKFNIKESSGKDDLSSMREVITRRYKRLKEENKPYPDLIIVDGGINQINVAISALKELEIDIPVAGLAKDNHHHTAFLIYNNQTYYVKDNEKLFMFLIRMQDEVHRYAITFHRKKREKKIKNSIFDDIPGIGIKRKEALLKAYPSRNDLLNATVEELMNILPKSVAIEIVNKIKNNNF